MSVAQDRRQDIWRQWMTEHYSQAVGRVQCSTSWNALFNETDGFIDPSCYPPDFVFQDPSHVKSEHLTKFFNHVRAMEIPTDGSEPRYFRFKQVKEGAGFVAARYPRVLASPKRTCCSKTVIRRPGHDDPDDKSSTSEEEAASPSRRNARICTMTKKAKGKRKATARVPKKSKESDGLTIDDLDADDDETDQEWREESTGDSGGWEGADEDDSPDKETVAAEVEDMDEDHSNDDANEVLQGDVVIRKLPSSSAGVRQDVASGPPDGAVPGPVSAGDDGVARLQFLYSLNQCAEYLAMLGRVNIQIWEPCKTAASCHQVWATWAYIPGHLPSDLHQNVGQWNGTFRWLISRPGVNAVNSDVQGYCIAMGLALRDLATIMEFEPDTPIPSHLPSYFHNTHLAGDVGMINALIQACTQQFLPSATGGRSGAPTVQAASGTSGVPQLGATPVKKAGREGSTQTTRTKPSDVTASPYDSPSSVDDDLPQRLLYFANLCDQTAFQEMVARAAKKLSTAGHVRQKGKFQWVVWGHKSPHLPLVVHSSDARVKELMMYLQDGPGVAPSEEEIQRYCLTMGMTLRDLEILLDLPLGESILGHLPIFFAKSELFDGPNNIEKLLRACERRFLPPPLPRPRGKAKQGKLDVQASPQPAASGSGIAEGEDDTPSMSEQAGPKGRGHKGKGVDRPNQQAIASGSTLGDTALKTSKTWKGAQSGTNLTAVSIPADDTHPIPLS
ncbi:hypothetical protein LXA43DRAFT_1100880 [Ganoderma leucocontextum]|nr:hypothetical protein LXA43DRAFT_1100880 [Ganoderma leucocontextum]